MFIDNERTAGKWCNIFINTAFGVLQRSKFLSMKSASKGWGRSFWRVLARVTFYILSFSQLKRNIFLLEEEEGIMGDIYILEKKFLSMKENPYFSKSEGLRFYITLHAHLFLFKNHRIYFRRRRMLLLLINKFLFLWWISLFSKLFPSFILRN